MTQSPWCTRSSHGRTSKEVPRQPGSLAIVLNTNVYPPILSTILPLSLYLRTPMTAFYPQEPLTTPEQRSLREQVPLEPAAGLLLNELHYPTMLFQPSPLLPHTFPNQQRCRISVRRVLSATPQGFMYTDHLSIIQAKPATGIPKKPTSLLCQKKKKQERERKKKREANQPARMGKGRKI